MNQELNELRVDDVRFPLSCSWWGWVVGSSLCYGCGGMRWCRSGEVGRGDRLLLPSFVACNRIKN